MGGCASAPKDLKKDDGAGSAAVPEPSKEETVEAEQEGVEKVGEENSEKNGGDKKSLGSLLDEDEIEKESAEESKAEEVPSEKKQQQ
ncbi:hypothetical protein SADUNF_Sadunf03G0014400 [Salix dunnii]|uniref:Uncharacterized protein n=1 Tax=Salix dunnii TaxID=1413687 RepID=A0A835N1F6_9ROSI|nr:hypothetical protein SADUNF_Sadunf03G0014400 [Salix dunnii]